jgi:hypothetical protein
VALVVNKNNMNLYRDNWNGFNRGYVFGWANGQYASPTEMLVDNFTVSETNIFGVTG